MKVVSRIVTFVALVIGLVGVAAAPASADPPGTPTGCTVHEYSAGAYSVCTGGPGYHRVYGNCWKTITGGLLIETKYGPWKAAKTQSWMYCSSGFTLVWASNEVKPV